MAKNKRRFGDRRDGKRVRNLDSLHTFLPYLMPKRCDSEVFIREIVDVSPLLAFIEEKNKEKEYHVTPFHVFASAIAKTITMRPLLNRFIKAKRFYERDHVCISFIAKKKFDDHSEEAVIMLHTKQEDTFDDISKKIVGDVHSMRKQGSNAIGNALDVVAKLPRLLSIIFFALVRFADTFGLLPEALLKTDMDFSTVIVSNLGSIKCGAPYHHLSEYGTTSIIITIGEIHKECIYSEAGEPQIRDVAEIGVTLDERIGDGFYFAKSVKLLKYLIAHPELLEKPLNEEINYEY